MLWYKALQASVLAVAPWLVNLAISMYRHTPFSVYQAAFCTLLLAGGGMAYFTLAVLISSFVEGENTAAAVTYGLTVLSAVVPERVQELKQLNLIALLTGGEYVNHQTYLFSGGFPWLKIAASLSAAVLMIFTAIAITQRRDY